MTHEFLECDTCRAKPGFAALCHGCLTNRATIAAMNAAADRMEEMERSARAWDYLMAGLHAIVAADAEDGAVVDDKLNAYIAAWEQQKRRADEAEACLRRCAIAASNLTSDPDNVSADDGRKIDSAMANPLNADNLVNDRICELECQVAQLQQAAASRIAHQLSETPGAIESLADSLDEEPEEWT